MNYPNSMKESNEEVLVSVFCFTYNHFEFINAAIDSFLMQETSFVFEVIVHDDCSTDGTTDIIKKYQEEHEGIIKPIFQKANKYSKGELNIPSLLSQASGKYIAICDGDDYWLDAMKLQKQVDFLEKNDDFMGCAHNTKLIGVEDGLRVVTSLNKDVFYFEDFALGHAYFHTSSMMYRNMIGLSSPYQFMTDTPGDWLLQMAFSKFGPIKYLDEVMSVYRIHDKGEWSLLNDSQKLTKNLKAVIKFNQIFNFEYEDLFFSLFLRRLTDVKGEDIYSDILLDASKINLVHLFSYFHRDVNTKFDELKLYIEELEGIKVKQEGLQLELNKIKGEKDQVERVYSDLKVKNKTLKLNFERLEREVSLIYSSKAWKIISLLKKIKFF